ncbi:alpha/beta hydrolase [Caminibacter pacificus]
MNFNVLEKIFFLFLFLLLVYIISALYLYLTQNSKVFQRKYAKEYTPKYAKKLYFTTSDGKRLEGAYLENKKGAPLVLYFSGNANNVIEFIDNIAVNIKDYNFLGFNYPGYAGSEGEPCEEYILKYALEIFDKYKPQILIGRSLGTAVATYVAANRDVEKLVLITPFDSIEHIAQIRYPVLPISLLLKHKFKEVEWIKNVKAPVSVLLVKNDDIIPQKSIDNLLKHIPNLNKKIEIEGVTHGRIYEYPNISKVIEELLK